VLTCLHPHLLGSANFSQFQSAYRKLHSTKTDDYSGKVKNHHLVILTVPPQSLFGDFNFAVIITDQ